MVKSIMGDGGEKGALAFLKISHFRAVTTIICMCSSYF